jgi:hypothetical protein
MRSASILLIVCFSWPAAAHAERDQLLTVHNELRARHSVPPLTWSEDLATGSQAWAERCVFEHSTGRYGENLIWWRGGSNDPAARAREWYDEIKDYNFAAGDKNDLAKTGHFTQMIWRGSKALGCGLAKCQDGSTLMVCRYTPPGNVIGRFRENVPPAK